MCQSRCLSTLDPNEPLNAEPENALSRLLPATEKLRLSRRLSSDTSAEDEALRLAMKNAILNTPGLNILQKQLRINTLTLVDRCCDAMCTLAYN
jgi:hypothetical protein